MTTAPIAVLVLLALSACGQGATGSDGAAEGSDPTTVAPGEPTSPLPTSPASGAAELPAEPTGAELTLVPVGPDGTEQPPVVLSCDWAAGTVSGDHPQAEQACADLEAAVQEGNPFAPVPPDVLCTQQYGGDAVVEVSGAVLGEDGGPVDLQARFSLTDGCEIARWEQLGAVLAPFRGDT